MNPTSPLTAILGSLPLAIALCALATSTLDGDDQDPKTTPARTPFDDTKWVVELVPDVEARKAGERPSVDVLVVTGGKLHSRTAAARGFVPPPVTATRTTLTAEAFTDDRRNKCEWSATAVGDTLSGTLVSTRLDGSVVRYAFEGRRATPLEGTRWAITLRAPSSRPTTAESRAGSVADGAPETLATLTFLADRITCDAPFARVAGPAPFTFERLGARTRVTSEGGAEQRGRVRWEIALERDELQGTLHVTSEDGSRATYELVGKRQPDVVEPGVPKLPDAAERTPGARR